MPIHSVLRHRATVKRSQKNVLTGDNEWSTVTASLPCLLSTATAQAEPTYSAEQQRTLDRTGTLFTAADADLLPGDRVLFTRGAVGRYLVKPDPANVSTLHGPLHCEFRVEQA